MNGMELIVSLRTAQFDSVCRKIYKNGNGFHSKKVKFEISFLFNSSLIRLAKDVTKKKKKTTNQVVWI